MEILSRIQTDDFELVIRGNRVEKNQRLLESALSKRQKTIPNSVLLFSNPVNWHLPTIASGFSICSNSIPFYKIAFYENTQYAFDFVFTDEIRNPKLTHALNRINEDCFYSEQNELHGQINFGNNIGRFNLPFSYQKAGATIEQSIAFDVWPTKMDMRTDLQQINTALDAVHPFLRFAFAKETQQGFARTKQKHPPFDVLWIAEFQSLRDQILTGFKKVLNAPHSRLMPEKKFLKLHQLKGKQSSKLLQTVKQDLHQKRFDARYEVNQKRLSVDTPENQFIKFVLQTLIKKTQQFANKSANWDANTQRLSQDFYNQLEVIIAPFKRLQTHILFKEVSDFQGMKKASLVLQQKTGYSAIYRNWFELRSYLNVLGQEAQVSQKNVAELYEVWCFLEMRRIFISEDPDFGLGFEDKSTPSEFAVAKGMEYQIPSGEKHAFEFEKGEGSEKIHVQLRHEKSFGDTNLAPDTITKKHPKPRTGIVSWMTNHRPDIYMEVNFSGGEQFIWLFDAKYRIDLDRNDQDWVPQDALYQMHRYRDALIYRDRPDEKNLSRPVYGAYALYPGYFENQSSTQNPYHESINQIDIGAFPMLPGQNQEWLVNFLKDILGLKQLKSKVSESEPTYRSRPPLQAHQIKQRPSAKITPR